MSRTISAAAIAVLFCALVLVEFHAGAWHKDFVSDPDEPAHAVSSLMIRDYIAAGFPGNPLHFAEVYYLHYPKVALGHWPPLFHASEAVWMLAFGRSRGAMLLLPAALDFALLIAAFLWTKKDCGNWAALLSAILLLVPPFMQTASWSVAPNILLALLAFCAAVVYGAFLATSRRAYLLLFGFLVAACVATHGRGVAVALIPLVVWLFEARTRRNPWRIAVLLLTLGVLIVMPGRLQQSFQPSLGAALDTSRLFIHDLSLSLGLPAIVVAIVGAIRTWRFARWRPMVALPLAALIFHAVVNVAWEDRFLTIAAAPIACLAGAGLLFLWQSFAHHWQHASRRTWTAALAALSVAVVVLWYATHVEFVEKADLGYHRIAPGRAKVFLAAGDPRHEGALVSEIALRDSKLESIVLRSSKVLFQSNWLGTNYRLLFRDAGAVSQWLDTFPVEVIVVQTADPDPDIAQLLEALQRDPSAWSEAPAAEAPLYARLFRRISPLPPGPTHLRIDMRKKLGKFLDLDLGAHE